MNKIKKFLHMMVAFAFAFVLAIGGIGIKSAKVASAQTQDLTKEDFTENAIDAMSMRNTSPLVIVDRNLLDNLNDFSNSEVIETLELILDEPTIVISWDENQYKNLDGTLFNAQNSQEMRIRAHVSSNTPIIALGTLEPAINISASRFVSNITQQEIASSMLHIIIDFRRGDEIIIPPDPEENYEVMGCTLHDSITADIVLGYIRT